MISQFEDNISIYWMDLKGHGLSSGGRNHIENFTELTDDVSFFINHECNEIRVHQPVHKIVLGQGLGGLITLSLLQSETDHFNKNIHGIILSNPILRPTFHLPNTALDFLHKLKDYVGKLRVPFAKREEIVNNWEMAMAQTSDPLIPHSISCNFINEIIFNAEKVRKSSFFPDIPMLFLASGKDVVTDVATTKIFHKGPGQKVSKLIFYNEMKHDILNDIGASVVYRDIGQWLQEKFL